MLAWFACSRHAHITDKVSRTTLVTGRMNCVEHGSTKAADRKSLNCRRYPTYAPSGYAIYRGWLTLPDGLVAVAERAVRQDGACLGYRAHHTGEAPPMQAGPAPALRCTPWLCAHLFKVALVASRLGCCSDQSLSACLTHLLEANLALPLYKNIPRTHPPFPRRRHGCPVIYICFPHPVKLEWSRAEDDRQPPVQSWSSPFSPFCTHPTCFPPSGPSILLFC